ncbi:MAG: TRAP transporter small permease [Betaproteobacteria bacterium]|nr:TRAP transporter small permease [Betaproteobacteria bacterium]
MIAQTIARETGLRMGGSDDLVSWFCAASAFLAMAHTFKRGDLVRVTLLLENLAPRVRHVFEAISLAFAACFSAYLLFWAIRYSWESWQFNEMATGLIVIPMWIPQLSFVAGAALLFIAILDELVTVLLGNKPGYVLATEERHRRGDFSGEL